MLGSNLVVASNMLKARGGCLVDNMIKIVNTEAIYTLGSQVTPLDFSFTRKSVSNKLLIIANLCIGLTNSYGYRGLKLYRGLTAVTSNTNDIGYYNYPGTESGWIWSSHFNCNMLLLDDPGANLTVNYNFIANSSLILNWNSFGISSIIVLELKDPV